VEKVSEVKEKLVQKELPKREAIKLQSRESLNPLLEDLLEEVVLKEYHLSSMTTPDKYSRDSLKVLSEMLSHTLSMLEEKQLQQWMLYMPLKDKEELFMVLAVDNSFKLFVSAIIHLFMHNYFFNILLLF
jgi:hypothetical protein